MERYSVIEMKNPREMLLLKSRPCHWGLCSFCDYISDNDVNVQENIRMNKKVIKRVTGIHRQLEIINSGSCMELPNETLSDIQAIVTEKAIEKLYFEAHYQYKHELEAFRKRFTVPIVFKTGIETFDDDFRNKVLKKGVYFNAPSEVASHFESICLLVGIQGQTKAMIHRDIEILLKNFKYGCINIFQNNSTPIKADKDLIEWFHNTYGALEKLANIEILWHNTDFGVGGNSHEA
ncbi:radical SAM protein [Fusibacter paucivorans]|uniref:Radical SAM protein n=1 Tax=Fusibacter paucivorans TaxID=76009 RepID=A0ABS5PS45_9FIRM|nr:radical SAM protein [Fusibacter paucivorans]